MTLRAGQGAFALGARLPRRIRSLTHCPLADPKALLR
jgi:hypothetical protein